MDLGQKNQNIISELISELILYYGTSVDRNLHSTFTQTWPIRPIQVASKNISTCYKRKNFHILIFICILYEV